MIKINIRNEVNIGIYEFILYLILLMSLPLLGGHYTGILFGVTVFSVVPLVFVMFVWGLMFSRLYAFVRGKVIGWMK